MDNTYGYYCLEERYGNSELPAIDLIDQKKAWKQNARRKNFSYELISEIEKTISKNEQVLIFQNRRGFSAYAECFNCHHIPRCRQCDVSLTYHKLKQKMICHYCGTHYPVERVCGQCHSTDIVFHGYGTEQIEEMVVDFFPEAHVVRLDSDVAQSKKRVLEIFGEIESNRADILVGTNMISKGIDFKSITLIAVLSADGLLFYPDFRASERCFQILTQVSGRAGRRGGKSKVKIQTFQIEHPLFEDVQKSDFHSFIQREMRERKEFLYPPYSKLIYLFLKHKEEMVVTKDAENVALLLKSKLGTKRVYGPEFDIIPKVRGRYIKKIMLKIENGSSAKKAKEIVQKGILELKQKGILGTSRIEFDVDPF